MEITELALYKPVFVLEILLAMHMFSYKLPKKKNSILRFLLSIGVVLTLSIIFPLFKISYSWWFSSLMFLTLFLLCFASLFFVYDVPWYKLFFISIAGYTTQHFSHELYALIARFFELADPSTLGMYGDKIIDLSDPGIRVIQVMTYLEVHFVVYLVFFFVFRKKISNYEIRIDNKSLLLIASLILLINIILSSIITYLHMQYNRVYYVVIGIYNLLSCLMVLYLQFFVMDNRRLKNELEITSQLLHQSKVRYQDNKKNVDLINLKCHDLKHQIREHTAKGNITKDTINELEEIINIYDSNVRTGNEALDLILTEKSLLCQKANIKLSCLADCSNLSFIADSDLYCLFGNAIDNAVEAVMKIQDSNKRQINLIVRNVYSLVSINIENYYTGELIIGKDNLPITTKSNKDYHGFGMKSIKMIVDKYHGDLKITKREDIFSLAILFPSQEKVDNP